MCNMPQYIRSAVFSIQKDGKDYQASNLISGRIYRISTIIYELLVFCNKWQSLSNIIEHLKNGGATEKDIACIVRKLVEAKLLLPLMEDMFDEIVRDQYSFFNVGFSDMNKINDKIAFLGIPFGNGNGVDNRCKDFPMYFRKTTSQSMPIIENIDNFNGNYIHYTFNKQILSQHIKSKKITDVGNIFHCTGENNESVFKRIKQCIALLIKNGNVPFIIGGDHSITYPILLGFSECGRDFTLLHFDAHSDFKESQLLNLYSYINFKLLNHATVMTYCSQLDNIKNIVQIGVREPFKTKLTSKFKSVSLDDIRCKNNNYKKFVKAKVNVYISFDVDFFDPIFAPGTASRLINGAAYNETFTCLYDLLKNKEIIGVDIVEANNCLDVANRTTQLVANLALHILSMIKK